MKKLYTFLFAATFMLLGCTETIYEEVIKRDTLWLEKPRQAIAPSFITVTDTVEIIRIDTVEIQTVITKTDTLIQIVTKDSLIIQTVEKIVEHRDTVVIHDIDTVVITLHDTTTLTEYETRIVYLNTEYIYIFPGQSVTYIPAPFEPHFQAFRDEANARNKPLPGGDMVLMRVDPSELAGDNWTSDSWEVQGFQWVLRISDQLTVEQSKSAIFRELGRIQLKKKYSNDVTRIMSPLFRTSPEPTSQEINTLFAQ